MNNKYYNGGSAFPVPMVAPQGDFLNVKSEGMTLRDWFAGQALAGLLAHHGAHVISIKVADSAYAIANEMIILSCNTKKQ